MTTELYWLTLTVLMTALFWVPYILNRIAVRGLITAITGVTPETVGDQSMWAQRAIKAHQNAVENLAVIVPVVLIAHILNISTPVTQTAIVVYFFARLVHFLVYTAGIPVVRTLAFATGWAAQMAFVAAIHGWL